MTLFRTIAMLAAATTVALPTGCTSSADKVSDDRIAVPDIDAVPTTPHGKLGYRLDWQGFPAVAGAPTQFELLGDTIAVLDSRNNLTVMDTTTGRNRWSTSVGHRLERIVGLARFEDSLVVCSETLCQLFDIKTGKLLARHNLSSLANTPPVVVRDIAVVGCSNGELLGHSLSTGFKAWGYMLEGVIGAQPVVISGYDVGAVSQAGDVLIVDASTGTGRGRLTSIFGGLANAPVASDRRLFVASLDQSVYAFDRESGDRTWRVRTESRIRSQPTYNDGRLYIALDREGMVSLDANTGERVWSNAAASGVVIGARSGALLVRDGDTIHRLRTDSGETVESIAFAGIYDLATETFADGPIYTIDNRGLVQKFVPEF
jgi:outer membrane protein assembly factor BamB